EMYPDVPGTHRRHVDFDRRNNRPTNIQRMNAADHIRLHNAESYGEDFDPKAHGAAIHESLKRRAEDPLWREHFSMVQAARANEFWADARYAEIRRSLIEARRNPSDATREAHRRAMVRRYSDPAERHRQGQAQARAWHTDNGSRRQRQAELARHL